MIYLVWNCCGLGYNMIVQAPNRLIRQHIPYVIFIPETKIKDHIINGVRRRMGFGNGFNVPLVGMREVSAYGGRTARR